LYLLLLKANPLSPYGHDKSLAILPWRKREKPPLLIFFGDGVSGAPSIILRPYMHKANFFAA
jgi:2-hydroxy-3-keto-5-methylthiopentenyl-1-phosphate phosphatase